MVSRSRRRVRIGPASVVPDEDVSEPLPKSGRDLVAVTLSRSPRKVLDIERKYEGVVFKGKPSTHSRMRNTARKRIAEQGTRMSLALGSNMDVGPIDIKPRPGSRGRRALVADRAQRRLWPGRCLRKPRKCVVLDCKMETVEEIDGSLNCEDAKVTMTR